MWRNVKWNRQIAKVATLIQLWRIWKEIGRFYCAASAHATQGPYKQHVFELFHIFNDFFSSPMGKCKFLREWINWFVSMSREYSEDLMMMPKNSQWYISLLMRMSKYVRDRVRAEDIFSKWIALVFNPYFSFRRQKDWNRQFRCVFARYTNMHFPKI